MVPGANVILSAIYLLGSILPKAHFSWTLKTDRQSGSKWKYCVSNISVGVSASLPMQARALKFLALFSTTPWKAASHQNAWYSVFFQIQGADKDSPSGSFVLKREYTCKAFICANGKKALKWAASLPPLKICLPFPAFNHATSRSTRSAGRWNR